MQSTDRRVECSADTNSEAVFGGGEADAPDENLAGDRSAIFVAEDDGDPPGVLGYCLALIQENPPVVPWKFHGLISEISADPEGRGIGSALLDSAHAWLRGRGIPYVEASVSIRNAQARRFWRKKGYAEFLERLRLEL